MTAQLNSQKLQTIRDYLDQTVAQGALPGYVALIGRGPDLWVQTGGTMAYGSPTALSRTTLFRISSMSKPITTAAAMILVDDGVLDLEAPIERWIPEFKNPRVLKRLDGPITETVPAERPIRVRDLLTYTMGTGMLMMPPDSLPILRAIDAKKIPIGPPNPQGQLPADEFVKRMAELPLMYQPGQTWLYHTSIIFLSILITRASALPLDRFFKERVFVPLGMNDTDFVVTPDKLNRLPVSYMSDFVSGAPHFFDGPDSSQWAKVPPFLSGADGLVATIDDYYRFASMLLNQGSFQGRRILSAESVQAMLSPQVPSFSGILEGETHHGFGFGLQVVVKDGLPGQPLGQFNWDGGLGTTWFAAPREKLIGILMTQKSWTSPKAPSYVDEFNRMAHEALRP